MIGEPATGSWRCRRWLLALLSPLLLELPACASTPVAAQPPAAAAVAASTPAPVVASAPAPVAAYRAVPGGSLRSVLAGDADPGPVVLIGFSMRVAPVSRGEFESFVRQHPEWQRGRAASSLAATGYLQDWPEDRRQGSEATARRPVTAVSWFAADAFCHAEGARLPSWLEWEYVAAADETRADARSDEAWLRRILAWYERPASAELPAVGGPPNFYGIRDVHGLVWEWVDDFNALLVDADSRSGDDPDRLKFCGAGAINLQDRQNYAVLMRIALLSSLQAADSTASLGFRCVRP